MLPDLRSGGVLLASEPPEVREAFLDSLSPGALLALPYVFEFWALEHQLPPAGNWRTWVIMGGRGAGKTRAGSEWVRSEVEGSRPCDPGRGSQGRCSDHLGCGNQSFEPTRAVRSTRRLE